MLEAKVAESSLLAVLLALCISYFYGSELHIVVLAITQFTFCILFLRFSVFYSSSIF